MTVVRRATREDAAQLAEMGERFIAATAYGELIAPTEQDMVLGLERVIEQGCVFVADRGGKFVGAIVGVQSCVWFSPSTPIVVELAWWVDEEARGSPCGVRLVLALEGWAREQGARFCAMSDLVGLAAPSPAAEILPRLDYVLCERTHAKEM